MKTLVYSAIRMDEMKNLGVGKKIRAQAKALGADMDDSFYSVFNGTNYQIINSYNDILIKNIPARNRVAGRIKQAKYTYRWCLDNSIGLVYIRYSYLDNITYNFAKNLKNSGIKVILELPTYPFWDEKEIFVQKALKEQKYFNYFCKKILIEQEMKNFKKASKVIDLIVTYNPTEDLFGVKTLCIDNGVDIDNISLRKPVDNGNKIVFLLIANLSRWHGADRFISGLSECKEHNGYTPVFWIVGEGNELENLKKQVVENALQDYVIFWGAKSGSELNYYIDNADIGIASLGMHRLGLDIASTLKVKEYCAYGLPFIYAYTEKEINDECNFALKCKSDDTPIDIKKAIDFAVNVRNSDKIPMEMRKLAEEKYDWKSIMKMVVENV